MALYIPFAPSLLGAVFFSLSFNFLFSICHALLSCLNIYLICPIKSLKKKDVPISVNVADDTPIDSRPIP